MPQFDPGQIIESVKRERGFRPVQVRRLGFADGPQYLQVDFALTPMPPAEKPADHVSVTVLDVTAGA